MLRVGIEWLWSLSSRNKKLDRTTCGKWIVKGNAKDLFEYLSDIDKSVEKGELYGAKMAHRVFPDCDVFHDDEPVLCIYADDSSKERTFKILKRLGIKPNIWKYDFETAIDWSPEGVLRNIARRKMRLPKDVERAQEIVQAAGEEIIRLHKDQRGKQ